MASEKQWLQQKWLVEFLVGSGLVALLLFLLSLGWVSEHGGGVPSYVVYVLIGLVAGRVSFMFMDSSAQLKGHKYGFGLSLGGAVAVSMLVLGGGIWYELETKEKSLEIKEQSQDKSFGITIYFKERLGDSEKVIDATGTARLLLDEPKERSLTKGWVRFEGIPERLLGEPIHLEVRVDGYVKDGFLSEQVPVNFEQGKTYHYFLKKALPPPPPEQSVDNAVSANSSEVDISTQKKELPSSSPPSAELIDSSSLADNPATRTPTQKIEIISEEVELKLEGYSVEEVKELLKSIQLFKQKVSLSPIMDAESWDTNYSLAEQGNTTAQMSLLASSVQRGDAENEQYWLDRVLKNAKPAELNSLAVMYLEGVDLPQDIERGLALLIEAAEQGDAEAQYNLGVLYEKGVFGEPDLVTAKSWYQKSAEQGFAPAQQQLAVLAGGLASTSPDSGDSTSAIKQVAGRVDGFDCQSVTDVPEAECLELVEFYNSTGGNDWRRNTDWLQSYTVCEWYGIECELGSVVEIRLYMNQLSGEIPNFNLPKLQKLDLWTNKLSGEIPNFNLPKLQTLALVRNQLSGKIPNFNLPKLQVLNLSENQLSGEIPNFNLPKLQKLDLWTNKLSGEIPYFNLPNLRILYLGSNQLCRAPATNYQPQVLEEAKQYLMCQSP